MLTVLIDFEYMDKSKKIYAGVRVQDYLSLLQQR